MDLQSEHERYLVWRSILKTGYLYNYPAAIKAFICGRMKMEEQ